MVPSLPPATPQAPAPPEADGGAPCLSVLMPCRNAGPFLEEAIDSVLADPAVLELLIADGGSDDGSREWIEARCHQERRLRLVSHADAGTADALNRAWPHVRGTMVGWLNADDRYLPGAPSRAVAALATHPHWLMVYGEGEHIDADGRWLDRYPSRPPEVGLKGFATHCFLCQPTVFWRRSLGVLLGPWDTSLQCAFDFDYWIRAFAAVPGRIGKINDVQAQTRRHDATLSVTRIGQAVLEATWLQATRLPLFSPHILRAYALELADDPHGQLPVLLEQLRAGLNASLPPGVREGIWATIEQALSKGADGS